MKITNANQLIGKRIVSNYNTNQIKQIISFNDYPHNGGEQTQTHNYYIEYLDTCNQYHYWKECTDAGRLIDNTDQIYNPYSELIEIIRVYLHDTYNRYTTYTQIETALQQIDEDELTALSPEEIAETYL
jgi:hypothetical protein